MQRIRTLVDRECIKCGIVRERWMTLSQRNNWKASGTPYVCGECIAQAASAKRGTPLFTWIENHGEGK